MFSVPTVFQGSVSMKFELLKLWHLYHPVSKRITSQGHFKISLYLFRLITFRIKIAALLIKKLYHLPLTTDNCIENSFFVLSIVTFNPLCPKEILISIKGHYFLAVDFLVVFSFLLHSKQQEKPPHWTLAHESVQLC